MDGMFLQLKVSASALEAQKVRMNVIASNMANVGSTNTPEGGPYKRKDVTFKSHMFAEGMVGVDVPGVVEDTRPGRKAYDPGHPDADRDGYVTYPNVNIIEESVNLMSASRSYEANLSLITAFKEMYNRTLDLAKS